MLGETRDGATWLRAACVFWIASLSKVKGASFTIFLDACTHILQAKKWPPQQSSAYLPTPLFFLFFGGLCYLNHHILGKGRRGAYKFSEYIQSGWVNIEILGEMLCFTLVHTYNFFLCKALWVSWLMDTALKKRYVLFILLFIIIIINAPTLSQSRCGTHFERCEQCPQHTSMAAKDPYTIIFGL